MKNLLRKGISATMSTPVLGVALGVGLYATSALANPFLLQDKIKAPEPILEPIPEPIQEAGVEEPKDKKKKKEKDPNKKAKVNKLFREDNPLKVSLHLPLRKIRSRRMGETGELPAKLILMDEGGNPTTFDIKVELRGISRQSKEICEFPPIKLNFKKSQVKKTVFAKQNKLKLVTYCNKSGKYKAYYFKEYLAYKVLNILTDYSFKARLLDVTYLDEKGGGTPTQRVGFVIEDVDDLAARHGMISLNVKKVPSKNLDYKVANLTGLFQYFIGNLDWSMIGAAGDKDCCHNGKILQKADGTGPIFPVPYDFDYSGIVNAPYAVPPVGMGVRNVTQRLFRGFCRHEQFNAENIALFNEKRNEITQAIMNFTLLAERDRKRTVTFIDKFYDMVNDPKKLAKDIVKKCVGKRDS